MAHEDLTLLTIADLAALCRSGEDWIRKAVAARRIPFTRPARETLFTRDQAIEIIKLHGVEPAHVPTRDEVTAKRAQGPVRRTRVPAQRRAS